MFIFAGDETKKWMSGLLAGMITALMTPFVIWGTGKLKHAYGAHQSAPTPPESSGPVPIAVAVRLIPSNTVIYPDGSSVPESGHTVQVTVQGLVDRAVVLTGMRAEVLERGDAGPRETMIMGIVDVRRFKLLLDERPPRFKSQRGKGFPFTVSSNDPEVFEIEVHTKRSVAWLLFIDWTDQGREGITRVDLAGTPFRTAASRRRSHEP